MSDDSPMRVAVVGASAGLGRCIGIGLAARGVRVAFMARRKDRLENAAKEAGTDAAAVACDVTDEASCQRAFAEVTETFGGLDALVYTTGMGVLAPLADVTAAQWAQLFATNVTGASLVTAAAAPHLAANAGSAVYLSSLSASYSTPWPMLGAYAVSKAALDKLVEAWRIEHPNIGFTRLAVGDSFGGSGDSQTEFNKTWDPAALDAACAVQAAWAATPGQRPAYSSAQWQNCARRELVSAQEHKECMLTYAYIQRAFGRTDPPPSPVSPPPLWIPLLP
nr:SDR family oxidoreductase [Mycolicibacterium poriferae]